MKITLGTDIRTKEVIPNSDFMATVNISGADQDPDGELVVIVCPSSESGFCKKIDKINITHTADMIVHSGKRVLVIEELQEKTLERYKLGRPVFLAIIDEDKKIIARYEI